jgi:histone H3/H4
MSVDDGEALQIEPEDDLAALPPAPKTKPKKKAPAKKRGRNDKEKEKEKEKEEEEEEKAVVPPPAPTKERVKHKPKARGDRLATAPVYRTHLQKDRQRRREEALKAGKEAPAHRKSKPGTVAAREIEFLNKANGLYLSTALVRRSAVDAIKKVWEIFWGIFFLYALQNTDVFCKVVPELKVENERIASRLRKRGKHVPSGLEVADSWAIEPGVIQLLRASMHLNLESIADMASELRSHCKRQTVKNRDIVAADKLLEKCGGSAY